MADDNRVGSAVQEPPTPAYLTLKDVKHRLRIGDALCYRLIHEGIIPSVRVGHFYRVPVKEFEEALANDLHWFRR